VQGAPGATTILHNEANMVQRLIPHGDGYALVFDRAMLEQLNIDPKAPIEIASDGQRLVLAAAGGNPSDFNRIVAKMDKRYGTMFRRLAE
jgi:hypothetical protein